MKKSLFLFAFLSLMMVPAIQFLANQVPVTAAGLITNMSVKDTANAADWSVRSNIQVGDQQYGDRTFNFTSVPSTVTGSDWIRTANDTKSYTGNPVVTFQVTADSNVYVAYSDEAISRGEKPSWLSGWTDTGDNIINNEPAPRTFSLFIKSYTVNSTVSLGPNNSTKGMYTIIVKANGATPTPTTTSTFTPTPTPTPLFTSTPSPTTAPGNSLITNLVVNDSANAVDWSIRTSDRTGIQTRHFLYGDRTFTISVLPSYYAGSDWIRTANDSKAYAGDPLATFKVTAAADVYVAYDDRVNPKPAWFSSWTDTGDNIVDSASVTYSLFKKTYTANSTISLGPNGQSSSCGNYNVIVKPAGAPPPTPTPNPGWDQVPVILSRIVPPVFPAQDFNITNYGAVGDGVTDCATSFKNAISACNAAGGGRVVVPAGTFLTGAIQLKSNVNLYVSQGATIKFSQDTSKYLPVVLTRFEGVECMNYSPFIYAYGQNNIAVTGLGTLNGQADSTHWWPWKNEQTTDRTNLFNQADAFVPVDQRVYGAGHKLRPNFIQPYKCNNILIDGVTLINSPMWEINPVLCTNVTVRNVVVNCPGGPNNDGCDPECCRDVLIDHVSFTTGDDCIAIKSGRNTDGRRIGVASENIVIQNCTFANGHGGITLGSECSGDIRNIYAQDSTLNSPNLDRVLRLKTNSVRGGIMEHIYLKNITVGQIADSLIHATMYYEEGDAGSFTPIIRNINVSYLTSQKSNYALWMEGYSRSTIDGVHLDNCTFDNVTYSNHLVNVTNLTMVNVRINGQLQ